MSGAEELNPCFAVRQSAEWVLSQTQLVSIDDGGEMGVCMQGSRVLPPLPLPPPPLNRRRHMLHATLACGAVMNTLPTPHMRTQPAIALQAFSSWRPPWPMRRRASPRPLLTAPCTAGAGCPQFLLLATGQPGRYSVLVDTCLPQCAATRSSMLAPLLDAGNACVWAV